MSIYTSICSFSLVAAHSTNISKRSGSILPNLFCFCFNHYSLVITTEREEKLQHYVENAFLIQPGRI